MCPDLIVTAISRILKLVFRPRTAYVATVAVFFWLVAAFYLPGKGFTVFVSFGENTAERYLPELKGMDVYIEPESGGYDAQHYAQIAMRPQIRDPELAAAVDNISYRARRILFSWTAWVLGGGDPERVLHVFAMQNIVYWLALAALLLRWFPADSWGNYLRWVAVLFSYGVWFSVRGALVDGPSLLLIAAGVALAEQGRTCWSAVVLGVSGLAKETNILAGGVLLDFKDRTPAGWGKLAVRSALVLLPLAVWVSYLWSIFGGAGGAGERNFAVPLAGFLEKWGQTLAQWDSARPSPLNYPSLLWMITVTVQFLFIVLRPRWDELWWRVGAAFAVLMVFLGAAVWEGEPGAAGRVLLPMGLAFNVLLPRGRAWLAVLLLGNLTIFGIGRNLNLPGYQSFEVSGSPELRLDTASRQRVEVMFTSGWYPPERSRAEYWRWSNGPTAVAIVNPHASTLVADVQFGLRSRAVRQVTIRSSAENTVIWSGAVTDEVVPVDLRGVRFGPGETVWRFETDVPAEVPGPNDSRAVAFSLRNLVIHLERAGE
ncbi:hypothetical protein CMV30_12505 [Nibricoccus aquaticus]|uniref:Glycosyltransferase RgtA/B/C/D-like domain-containing protein n=1 Tax=Nibricoccus aquaticus TaxID=2576891 RepID=A0A290Q876_9BACT|nr:hypothetical protein CMV30_12505 [Nibricoccus aquaticus]